MRLRVIACEVMARAVYWCAARSPNVVDVMIVRRGLHADPAALRGELQLEIDATPPGYDAIVLGYGLCGGATTGIEARDVPIALPRAHDCITVFLGSRERYAAEIRQAPATYWYVQDQIERPDPSAAGPAGAGLYAESDEELAATRAEYVAKYGEDNAAYLIEVMGAWQQHYARGAFIDMGTGNAARAAALVQRRAKRRGWSFEHLVGSLVLLRRLVDGEWNDDVLVLQPGERLAMSYDEDVVKAVPGLAWESPGA